MKNEAISERYALAIYKIAKQDNKVMEIYDELNNLAETIVKDEHLKILLTHPLIETAKKKDVIKKSYGKVYQKRTIDMILYLIDKKRIGNIWNIMIEYLKLYYSENNILNVDAVFAVKPSAAQEKNLVKKLKSKYLKDIKLSVKVDKSILGGGILKIGDEIIDGSLRRQFEVLRGQI